MVRLAAALAVLLCGCDEIGTPWIPRSLPAAAVSQAIASGPWILAEPEGDVEIGWLTAEPSRGRVWYGKDSPDRLAQEGGLASDHRVRLHGLPAGAEVRYRVEAAAPASGSFRTAPLPSRPFRVLVYGDNRTNDGDHALVVRACEAEDAQLALHTGDMVADAGAPSLWARWFREEHDLLVRTALVPTLGNHDATDSGGVAYARYFREPGKPAYRSLEYGPLHVVVLDSFEAAAGAAPHAGAISDAQRAWLEEDLRSVAKDRQVWVLVHQGPYAHPARPRAGHGGSEQVRQALLAAGKVHRIDAVFAGHEHFYERGEIEGLRYFVVGGGGAPLEDPDRTAPGLASAHRALSFVSVDVCGCHARGRAKDIAGQVLDEFTISDCDDPCPQLAQAKAFDGGRK
jgi:acid phosphatase type 7